MDPPVRPSRMASLTVPVLALALLTTLVVAASAEAKEYPLVGDWNGNGRTTPGWFVDGTVVLREATFDGRTVVFAYGRAGDRPVSGDWDGDGRDTIGVVRDKRWLLKNDHAGGSADYAFVFGRLTRGDYPLAGDWNGSGADTIGVVRGGVWYLRNSLSAGAAELSFVYGRVVDGDVPVVGDWNGDGRDSPGIVRDGTWYLRTRSSGGAADRVIRYGRATDTPVIGNWNGSGGDTAGVLRGHVWLLTNRLTGGDADTRLVFGSRTRPSSGAAVSNVPTKGKAGKDPKPSTVSVDPPGANESSLPPSPGVQERQLDTYPGQPAAGTVLWGAAIQGNGDPYPRHEEDAGVPMALRRTFFQWRHIGSRYLAATAKEDLEAGRLPWVSVKPPSWAETAAGYHDADIDELLYQLRALDGPVWLTIHHEPEGGGGVNQPDDAAGPTGHLAMNRRVRDRMTALAVDNVALAPIFMAWSWDPRSGRDVEEWWDDGVYDFIGVDHYRQETTSLVTPLWFDVRGWAASRGVDVAVGEWGLRGTGSAAGAYVDEWYQHAIGSSSDGRGARVVGLSAFDSGLNSPSGSWELQGAQRERFRELLRNPQTARSR